MTGLFDYLADGRIVHMRDLWKQMVFDLEIQSTDKPGYHLIVRGKIGSCLYLVNGPLVIEFASLYVGNRKCSVFNGMCQLEYKTQYKACPHR